MFVSSRAAGARGSSDEPSGCFTAVRERVGDSLDDDGRHRGWGCAFPSDIECDGFRTSACGCTGTVVAGKFEFGKCSVRG